MQYQNAKYETTMSYATRGMNGMIFLAGVWEFLEAWIPTYLVAEILDFSWILIQFFKLVP